MDEKRRGFKLGRAIRLSVYLARRVFEREETFVFESDETVGREGRYVRDVFVESERCTKTRFDRDGEFGAMMDVNIENDGPVTVIIDSKNKGG